MWNLGKFSSSFAKKISFESKIDNFKSFPRLIIIYGSKFFGKSPMDFKTSFLISPFFMTKMKFYMQKNDKNWEKISDDFYRFSHVKFHFGHKEWTSQKWCLEVHRTFSKEFRVKKRLSIVKTTKNHQSLRKMRVFWQKMMIISAKIYVKNRSYMGEMSKSNWF